MFLCLKPIGYQKTREMLTLTVLLLVCAIGVHSRCDEQHKIKCGRSDRCVSISYICDGDNDCGEKTDESPELCAEWRNSTKCSRGYTYCNRTIGKSGCVSFQKYCENDSDEPCEPNIDRRVCEMLAEGKIRPLNEIILQNDGSGSRTECDLEKSVTKGKNFLENVQHTLEHEGCPKLSTKVGDDCLSFFYLLNLTWGESQSFCKAIGGDLLIPSDISVFNNMVRHLKKYRITLNFWLGGTYNATTGWKWINEEPIDLDTAHWAIRHHQRCDTRDVYNEYRNKTVHANNGLCYYYTQAPAEVPRGSCIATTYKKYFLLSDENCLKTMSPLCKLHA